MKRSFESGHEKRKKLARQKEAASASLRISNFFAHPVIVFKKIFEKDLEN